MAVYLNTEKGSKHPGHWLPIKNKLRYVSNWIAIKYRYNLNMYRDFKSDTPIKPGENKGDSLRLDRLNIPSTLDPMFEDKRKQIITSNLKRICLPGEELTLYKQKELDKFKQSLINGNSPYFGIIQPEYIKLYNLLLECLLLFIFALFNKKLVHFYFIFYFCTTFILKSVF